MSLWFRFTQLYYSVFFRVKTPHCCPLAVDADRHCQFPSTNPQETTPPSFHQKVLNFREGGGSNWASMRHRARRVISSMRVTREHFYSHSDEQQASQTIDPLKPVTSLPFNCLACTDTTQCWQHWQQIQIGESNLRDGLPRGRLTRPCHPVTWRVVVGREEVEEVFMRRRWRAIMRWTSHATELN